MRDMLNKMPKSAKIQILKTEVKKNIQYVSGEIQNFENKDILALKYNFKSLFSK